MFRLIPLCLFVIPVTASARKVPSWPYEKLFKEADVVVVAEAKETMDCDDKPTGIPMQEDFQAQTSTLRLHGTLKGKVSGEEIKVLHFRLKDGIKIDNGPCLVVFRTKSARVLLPESGKVGESGRPHYLIFLKAHGDGRYEPVSGHYDPALSVREMYRPLDR